MYTSIYTNEIPPLIARLSETPAVQRLSGVGMHCGCEYAGFPIYRQAGGAYSRYTHSVGVAGIIWNFTKDIRQAAAGLFHDIATPVFAHTIDFMNDDHMTQESTESKTRAFIENSREIMDLLCAAGIRVDEIDDYHRYPVADNDTPRLSADRLEYTLGNGYLVHHVELRELQKIYDDLYLAENEGGEPELCFRSLEMARAFTLISLRNSIWFVSDEDRFCMQYLADLVRKALDGRVLMPEDLSRTEEHVIQKIRQDPDTGKLWERYTEFSAVETASEPPPDRYCIRVPAKKRYIDPLVWTGGAPRRITELDPEIREKIGSFLSAGFDRWVFAREAF